MQRKQGTFRRYTQQLVGCTLFLGFFIPIFKQFRMLRKMFKKYDNLLNHIPEKVNFKKFIDNPGHKEYVILSQFNCLTSDQLFRNHMKMVRNYKVEAHKHHCYPQACNNFEGDVIENNKHLKFICNCKSLSPFVSSSLLCNIQTIQKQHIKTRTNMMIYGQMEYHKEKHMFIIYPEIVGTSKQEITTAWISIIGLTSPLLLTLFGLFFGIGSCLIYNQADSPLATATIIKEEIDKMIEEMQKDEKKNPYLQKKNNYDFI